MWTDRVYCVYCTKCVVKEVWVRCERAKWQAVRAEYVLRCHKVTVLKMHPKSLLLKMVLMVSRWKMDPIMFLLWIKKGVPTNAKHMKGYETKKKGIGLKPFKEKETGKEAVSKKEKILLLKLLFKTCLCCVEQTATWRSSLYRSIHDWVWALDHRQSLQADLRSWCQHQCYL